MAANDQDRQAGKHERGGVEVSGQFYRARQIRK